MKLPYILVLFFILPLSMSPGAEADKQNQGIGGSLLIDIENDAITNQDGHFTSAVSLTWQSHALGSYQKDLWLRSMDQWASDLPGFAQRDNRRLSIGLSQYIFTPATITQPTPDPNDMPYSGVLFARTSLSAQNADSLIAVGFRLGISGPPSLGERTQKTTHKIIGSPQPIGWEHQVGTEVLFNIESHYRQRVYQFGGNSWRGDLIGDGAVQAGTMLGMGSIGATLRWGWRVPNDFYINPIFMTDSTIGIRGGSDDARSLQDDGSNSFFSRFLQRTGFSRDSQWRIYGLASVSGIAISNAIFLNGNTYKNSRSVDYDPFASQGTLALIIQYDNFRAGASITATTVPWENPEKMTVKGYGRISLGFSF